MHGANPVTSRYRGPRLFLARLLWHATTPGRHHTIHDIKLNAKDWT